MTPLLKGEAEKRLGPFRNKNKSTLGPHPNIEELNVWRESSWGGSDECILCTTHCKYAL